LSFPPPFADDIRKQVEKTEKELVHVLKEISEDMDRCVKLKQFGKVASLIIMVLKISYLNYAP